MNGQPAAVQKTFHFFLKLYGPIIKNEDKEVKLAGSKKMDMFVQNHFRPENHFWS